MRAGVGRSAPGELRKEPQRPGDEIEAAVHGGGNAGLRAERPKRMSTTRVALIDVARVELPPALVRIAAFEDEGGLASAVVMPGKRHAGREANEQRLARARAWTGSDFEQTHTRQSARTPAPGVSSTLELAPEIRLGEIEQLAQLIEEGRIFVRHARRAREQTLEQPRRRARSEHVESCRSVGYGLTCARELARIRFGIRERFAHQRREL